MRYHFVEDGSSKFWEIEINGNALTVKWGRIGTDGQTQIKSFATDDEARAAHDKLVAEKLKKGYREAGGDPEEPVKAAKTTAKTKTKTKPAAETQGGVTSLFLAVSHHQFSLEDSENTGQLPPFRLIGTPAPLDAEALRAVEKAAGAPLPPWLLRVAGTWGWGVLADLFFVFAFPLECGLDELEALAKRWPSARRARWVVIGGDEGRNFSLVYARPGPGPGLYALMTNDRGAIRIGEGDEAFLAWIGGPGLERARLNADPLGAPSPLTYAVSRPGVDEAITTALADERPDGFERAIESALGSISRHRLAWEGIHMLLDPALRISDARRKQCMTHLVRTLRKNIAKTLAQHPSILEAVTAVQKTGRLVTPPETTVRTPPGVELTAAWNGTRDFLNLDGSAPVGRYLLRVETLDADGIERLNMYFAIDAQPDGAVKMGLTIPNGVRSVTVVVEEVTPDNEHIARGVNVYFHEDGTTSEDAAGLAPAYLPNQSPLHREGGPAELHGNPYYSPGAIGYWRHGKRHREDGPAVVMPCYSYAKDDAHRGYVAYYIDGLLHREDGPAMRYANGDEERWTRGVRERAPMEKQFLQTLRATPGDDATRLVYADWLEERGERDMAEYLRVDCERRTTAESDPHHRQLTYALDDLLRKTGAEWREAVSHDR